MAARWGSTDRGTFEVTCHQGFGVTVFGIILLLFAAIPLYPIVAWAVEMVRVGGSWRDAAAAIPGLLIALCVGSLLAVPGGWMAIRTIRTVCDKCARSVRNSRFYGLFWRTRDVRMADVEWVGVVTQRTRRGSLNRGRYEPHKYPPVHTVEIQASAPPRIRVAEFDKPEPAIELAKQMARYVEAEFRQETR